MIGEAGLRLAHYVEYDEVVLTLAEFFNSLCPPDIDQDAKHKGYEPTFFGGNFPASASFLEDSQEYPKSSDQSMQPGVVNMVHRLYLPSMYEDVSSGVLNDQPRKGAQLEALRLRALWRKELYDLEQDHMNLQGRVYRITVMRGESGDADRLGFPLAWENDGTSTTYLWVDDARIRVEL